MQAVVTGAAGFIGSTLTDRLLADGHDVVAIDSFSDYYAIDQKRANLRMAAAHSRCRIVEGDLLEVDLERLLAGADVVFHQAAQPGVRLSWSAFDRYVRENVLVTERLLGALRDRPGVRLIYASSSSVYGPAPAYPTGEDEPTRPHSPYGVTKLAGEHLCGAYARNWGLSTVSLRYFTVFGPRQRPDMAIHRLIEAARKGTAFPMLGDGSQVRDFTYVDDIVEANVLAAAATLPPGTVLNVAGESSWSMNEVIPAVEQATGRRIELAVEEAAPGDVPRTGGDTTRATELLGWKPAVTLEEGIDQQVHWHAENV